MTPRRTLAIWTGTGAVSGLGLTLATTAASAPIDTTKAAVLVPVGMLVGFALGIVNAALEARAQSRRKTRAAQLARHFRRADAVKRAA